MVFLEDLTQIRGSHMGINLRRLERLVTKQDLDVPDPGPIPEHERCAGMPKSVRRYAFDNPDLSGVPFDKRAHKILGHFTAQVRKK